MQFWILVCKLHKVTYISTVYSVGMQYAHTHTLDQLERDFDSNRCIS